MKIYVDELPKNCSKCLFMENMSKHWDVDDYCFLNRLSIGRFEKDDKCPLIAMDFLELKQRRDENPTFKL